MVASVSVLVWDNPVVLVVVEEKYLIDRSALQLAEGSWWAMIGREAQDRFVCDWKGRKASAQNNNELRLTAIIMSSLLEEGIAYTYSMYPLLYYGELDLVVPNCLSKQRVIGWLFVVLDK